MTNKDDGLEGKGGSADQSSRVQAVVSFFGPTDLTLNDWSEEVEKRILIPFLGDTIKNTTISSTNYKDYQYVAGPIVTAAGPWRTSGDWWTRDPWDRDEWDVGLRDGALYRIYCALSTGRWFVEGSFD